MANRFTSLLKGLMAALGDLFILLEAAGELPIDVDPGDIVSSVLSPEAEAAREVTLLCFGEVELDPDLPLPPRNMDKKVFLVVCISFPRIEDMFK